MRPGRLGWCNISVVLLLLAAATAQAQNAALVEDLDPAKTAAAAGTDERLAAVGGLSGAHLYTTYAYLNTLADAHRKKAYPPQRVRELATEVTRLLGTSAQHLQKVSAGKLAGRDKQAIEDFLATYKLLKDEAQALADYAGSNSGNDYQRFQQARNVAWSKLKEVLGIKGPAAEAEGNR